MAINDFTQEIHKYMTEDDQLKFSTEQTFRLNVILHASDMIRLGLLTPTHISDTPQQHPAGTQNRTQIGNKNHAYNEIETLKHILKLQRSTKSNLINELIILIFSISY